LFAYFAGSTQRGCSSGRLFVLSSPHHKGHRDRRFSVTTQVGSKHPVPVSQEFDERVEHRSHNVESKQEAPSIRLLRTRLSPPTFSTAWTHLGTRADDQKGGELNVSSHTTRNCFLGDELAELGGQGGKYGRGRSAGGPPLSGRSAIQTSRLSSGHSECKQPARSAARKKDYVHQKQAKL
jgi:hypothetical protein